MSNSTSRLARITAYAGWIIATGLAALLVLLLPRLRLRILERPQAWDLVMAAKQADLASIKWEDSRPLSVWIGDSHIEMGDWYDLFNGAYAIRNCGMTMATIGDVTRLVNSIPESRPETVIIMCGVNSLLQGATIESCQEDYATLLNKTQEHFQPHRLVVLAVMPVCENLPKGQPSTMNRRISEFNWVLAKLCAEHGANFIDANKAVTDLKGGLDFRLTQDGLHLNPKGYKALSTAIRKKFPHE
jgi:lysophospholipase L1-like esterase